MSSINASRQASLPYQTTQLPIDNDKPRPNPLDPKGGVDSERFNPMDKWAGDDAEYFNPATQSWQPTQAAGNGRYTDLGDPYREPVDFEVRANR